jgi:hypothetical protein
MAVKQGKKRILVTPSDEMYALLVRYSVLSGKPKATLTREILDMMQRSLGELLTVLESYGGQPEQFFSELTKMAERELLSSKQLLLDLNVQRTKIKRILKAPQL